MKIQFGLSQDEMAVLREAIASVTSRSFNSLVNDYRLLVQSLDGYAFSIYDYDNDLSPRVTLSQALKKCSPEIQSKVSSGLRSLDMLFEERTTLVKRSFDNGEPESDLWYSRLPARPGRELQDDIDSGNL